MTRAVAVRLGAFAGAVALAFAGAFAIGSTVDPVAAADPAPVAEEHGAMPEGEAGTQPPGLAVSQSGYTLVPKSTFFAPGKKETLAFAIQGPDGKAVTQYTQTHEKDLHLIVVRRDLSGFHHVHPTRAADGTWSIPFTFTAGGQWRIFTDFQPTALGKTLTLGADVNVSGLYIPVPLNEPASVYSVDGYDVTLTGTPHAGKESELTFSVSKAGKPVTDLQPYLGAFGHLVSARRRSGLPAHASLDGGEGGNEGRPGDHLRHHLPDRGDIQPVPGLSARRQGAHRRVHREHRQCTPARCAPPSSP